MVCTLCDCTVRPGDRYLQIGRIIVCKDCVDNNMEEYDPEGDYIDSQVDEMIERRLGLS